eukprot:tig00000760_g3943.t1
MRLRTASVAQSNPSVDARAVGAAFLAPAPAMRERVCEPVPLAALCRPTASFSVCGGHASPYALRSSRTSSRSRPAGLRWSASLAFGHVRARPSSAPHRPGDYLPPRASAVDEEALEAEAETERGPLAPGDVLEFVASGARLVGTVVEVAESGKNFTVAPLAPAGAEAKPMRIDVGQIVFRWPAGITSDDLRESARGGSRERETARCLRQLPRSAEELWKALRRMGEQRAVVTSESLAQSYLADRSGRVGAPALYAAHRLLAASDPYLKRGAPGEGYEAATEQEVRAKKLEPIVRWMRARAAGEEEAGPWSIAWAPEIHALELAAIEGNDAGVPQRAVPAATRRAAAALVAGVGGGLPKGGAGVRLLLLRTGLWTLREGADEAGAAAGAAAFLSSCEPFSAAALAEADEVARRADAFAAAAAAGNQAVLEGRRDLRGGRWGTPLALDPVASSLPDDAFSVPLAPPAGGGVEVAVHVADAARLVAPQGELARYAHLRMYLPSALVPMLPLAAARALALRDSAPNAAVTAVLRVDAAGALAGVELFRSLLPPVRRLTHAAADARLRGGGGAAVSEPEEWDGQDAALRALAAVGRAREGAGRTAAAAARFGEALGTRLRVTEGGEVEATTALRGGAAGAVAALLEACGEGIAQWAESRPEGPLPLPQIAPWNEERKLPGTAPLRRFPDLFLHWQVAGYMATGRARYDRRAVEAAGRWANARLRAVADVEEASRQHWGLLALERAAAATPGRLVPATVARVLDARRGVYAVRAGAGRGRRS